MSEVHANITTNGHKSWFVTVWKNGRRVDTRVFRSPEKAEKLREELIAFWRIDPTNDASVSLAVANASGEAKS